MPGSVHSKGARIVIFLYGVAVYVLFLATFLYAIGFIENVWVPKSIDTGVQGPVAKSILINMLLLGAFAVQHTIMARPWFKEWWIQWVPRPAERSTFVLATCLVLILLFWQWRPLPGIVWEFNQPAVRTVLYGLSAAGWALVLYASFLIDHFDLFGLRQVVFHLRGREYHHPGFALPRLYRLVRNPLMLGFMIAFWATPIMTQGRLLFAVLAGAYILMGIRFEERDLLRVLGEPYRRYRQGTPMLLPLPRRASAPPADPGSAGP